MRAADEEDLSQRSLVDTMSQQLEKTRDQLQEKVGHTLVTNHPCWLSIGCRLALTLVNHGGHKFDSTSLSVSPSLQLSGSHAGIFLRMV